MALRTDNQRWGFITRILHWSTATLVLGMLAAGLYAVSLDQSTPAGELRYYAVIDVHKSFGLLIIMLVTVRILWRRSERSPDWPATTPAWEKILARTSQSLLYLGLFLLPVAGYLWASGFGEPVRWFGLKLPSVVHLSAPQVTLAHHVHIYTAFGLMAVLALHLMGVLKNQLIDRTNVLGNMLGLAPKRPA